MSAAVPERRQVWEAMSELYLDAPVDAATLARVAAVLARSPYPPDELERILRHEVHPVLAPNLCSVAGVWSGFEPGWLAEAIVAHLRRPWPVRWWRARVMRAHAAALWRQLAGAVAAARRA